VDLPYCDQSADMALQEIWPLQVRQIFRIMA